MAQELPPYNFDINPQSQGHQDPIYYKDDHIHSDYGIKFPSQEEQVPYHREVDPIYSNQEISFYIGQTLAIISYDLPGYTIEQANIDNVIKDDTTTDLLDNISHEES